MTMYHLGLILRNNSMVNLSSIGENSQALFCLTPCCNTTYSWHNYAWVLPTGSNINSYLSMGLRSTRRPGALLLNRSPNVRMIQGIYTCRIPESIQGNAVLYIMGYNSDSDLHLCKTSTLLLFLFSFLS